MLLFMFLLKSCWVFLNVIVGFMLLLKIFEFGIYICDLKLLLFFLKLFGLSLKVFNVFGLLVVIFYLVGGGLFG